MKIMGYAADAERLFGRRLTGMEMLALDVYCTAVNEGVSAVYLIERGVDGRTMGNLVLGSSIAYACEGRLDLWD